MTNDLDTQITDVFERQVARADLPQAPEAYGLHSSDTSTFRSRPTAARWAGRPALVAVAMLLVVVAGSVVVIAGRHGRGQAGLSTGAGAPTLSAAHAKLIQHPAHTDPTTGEIPAGSVQLLDTTAGLLATLNETSPHGTIGGSWVAGTPGPTDRLVVESTADGAGRRALQDKADEQLPGRVLIKHGAYSRAQLQGFVDAVTEKFVAGGRGAQVIGVGLSTKNLDRSVGSESVVIATVRPDQLTDELLDELTDVVPASVLQVKSS